MRPYDSESKKPMYPISELMMSMRHSPISFLGLALAGLAGELLRHAVEEGPSPFVRRLRLRVGGVPGGDDRVFEVQAAAVSAHLSDAGAKENSGGGGKRKNQ